MSIFTFLEKLGARLVACFKKPAPPRMSPEQVARALLAAKVFVPAPPEADVEDPDYGF